MFSQGNYLSEYQALQGRLKKKRILKKPHIAEFADHFETLAVQSEGFGDTQTAGLCWRSAAKCAAFLGHVRQEANCFVKAARIFIKREIQLVQQGLISTEEDLHQALHCYHEALDRLQHEDRILAGSINLELAGKLDVLNKPKASLFELKKSLIYFQDYPIDKIECLRKIMILQIKQDDYEEALKSCSDAIEILEKFSTSGQKDSKTCEMQVYRLLLLLIVEPASSQVSKKDAQFLEKFTWIDGADSSGELVDLNSTLASAQLGSFSMDLFLLLQSLVMIVQSCDITNAVIVETALTELLSEQQCELLRSLVRRLEEKVH